MKEETLVTVLGRKPEKNHGIINPPVYHASTVLFPTLDALEDRKNGKKKKVIYGLAGTPTQFELEEAVSTLEGGYDAALFPSGLAAIAAAILAFVGTGDHVLMLDSVYGPTRGFCDYWLKKFGIETTYYDPLIGGDIRKLIRPETKVVFTESPGSLTFEVQDVPAIADVAHQHGAVVLMDNTWASPLFFKPFEHGVDASIQAGTKYMAGHSDVMIGTVTATEECWPAIKKSAAGFGQQAAPDDCFLTLRGIRTLAVRLVRHQETALTLADWLKRQPEVKRILHPADPGDPGHELWRRDFKGASGLFGMVLEPVSRPALASFLDGLELFGMGYSWGGFESLILPAVENFKRTATAWDEPGRLIRIHAGLENPDDLISDLDAGFKRLRKLR